MQADHDSALVLFPGALGDFLCLLPTLVALRARHRGRMLLIANTAVSQLLRLADVDHASIDRQEMAQLFVAEPIASSSAQQLLGGFDRVYSWTGFGNPDFHRHMAAVTGGRVDVYPFRGMEPREHAVDYYARCAGVIPRSPVAEFIADDPGWFAGVQRQNDFERGFAVFHAGSGSPRKNWQGFPALIQWWKESAHAPAVLLRGPAEIERGVGAGNHIHRIDTGEGADLVVGGLTLPQVAVLLRRARLYVGNDSGISHLAAAVGTRGVALFGPTDPAVWSPRGRHVDIVHAPDPCPHCGSELFCVHRLPVQRVLEAMRVHVRL